MTKFVNKTTRIRIEAKDNTFSLYCDNCETMNYVANSPELAKHFYRVMLKTLNSMKENNCTIIKIYASWE